VGVFAKATLIATLNVIATIAKTTLLSANQWILVMNIFQFHRSEFGDGTYTPSTLAARVTRLSSIRSTASRVVSSTTFQVRAWILLND
jgi:hypothetical protein